MEYNFRKITNHCKHDRDFNSSKNIENEGKRILKIGLNSPELTPDGDETIVSSLKQEKNIIKKNF